MVRIQFAISLNYTLNFPAADFVFNIHAAQTARQHLVSESLVINPPLAPKIETDTQTAARFLRLHVDNGPLYVGYQATLDIDHYVGNPDQIQETPVAQLPLSVLTYIYPSRYCQSDRLSLLAMNEFGH